jgi:ubiquinone/menaquinone biosynthesis C-methylase UbiE
MVALNRLGTWWMNSPMRAFAQRRYVAPLLERLGGRVTGGRALEVGCGRGIGVEVILRRFGARSVEAIDADPAMVALARRRFAAGDAGAVEVGLGDATRLEAPDSSCDAVFDFGAIHQIAEWPAAVSEVRRVLKPDGRFFFEEIAWRPQRWLMRFSVQDYADLGRNPFSPTKFLSELDRQGFRLAGTCVTRRILSLSGVIGDLIGVGRRDS